VPDDRDRIMAAVTDASATCDAVLLNAGSGKGSGDHTEAVLSQLGSVHVHSVAIKPGKPFISGIIGGTPVLGIPGYPVSAFLTFRLFALPLLERLCGAIAPGHGTIRAVVPRQVSSSLGIDEFVRVKVGEVSGRFVATPSGRGAGLLMSLVRADGLLKIPASSEGLSAGTDVEIELLRSSETLRHTIVCIGSHDNTLDLLSTMIRKDHPAFSFSSAHVGSLGGLMALKRGEAHLAGTHLLDEESGEYNVSYIKRYLPDMPVVLVNLVYRIQGFVVPRGNPKAIKGFEDLAREDVVFINRQAGSGTRLLLDKHLRDRGIAPSAVIGYDRDEYTHMAVASAVKTGLADTGLAILSSAQALGLDFVPVAEERYDLAIPAAFMEMEGVRLLLETIREDEAFRSAVVALGGYDVRDMGRVVFSS
jgi:putative molybdopterin biosynthesis protein